MNEISAVNEAAKAQGMSYGQYVLQNEMPAEPPERAPEEDLLQLFQCWQEIRVKLRSLFKCHCIQ